MNLANKLKSKNIKVIEIPKWGVYLRKQWEDNFANHLTNKEKKEIYLYDFNGSCGYLWHLFCSEKRNCLQGENANKAFNSMKKGSCYIFYQHSDDVLIIDVAENFKASDLISGMNFYEPDTYVVDKGFNWTYALTHENGWIGPYFSLKNEGDMYDKKGTRDYI